MKPQAGVKPGFYFQENGGLQGMVSDWLARRLHPSRSQGTGKGQNSEKENEKGKGAGSGNAAPSRCSPVGRAPNPAVDATAVV